MRSLLENSGDTVIKEWRSSDGLSWYRKWKSGWVEQGGYDGTNSGNNGHNVNLHVPFSDSNFFATASSSADGYLVAITSKSTTCFWAHTWFSNQGYQKPFYWYACGY